MKAAGFWNVTPCSPMSERYSEMSVYLSYTAGRHTPEERSVFSAVFTACCRIRSKTKDGYEKIYNVQNKSINSNTAEIISYTECSK
jgi:hypothetical protein